MITLVLNLEDKDHWLGCNLKSTCWKEKCRDRSRKTAVGKCCEAIGKVLCVGVWCIIQHMWVVNWDKQNIKYKKECLSFLKINLIYFQFSVSQFAWQIWQTNNSIKSYKPNRIMKKAKKLCLGLKKSLSSPRLDLTAQGMVQHTDDQNRLWYHSAIQAPKKIAWVRYRRRVGKDGWRRRVGKRRRRNASEENYSKWRKVNKECKWHCVKEIEREIWCTGFPASFCSFSSLSQWNEKHSWNFSLYL